MQSHTSYPFQNGSVFHRVFLKPHTNHNLELAFNLFFALLLSMIFKDSLDVQAWPNPEESDPDQLFFIDRHLFLFLFQVFQKRDIDSPPNHNKDKPTLYKFH